jgi:DNA-binding PadR family transcriptional regulator
MNDETRTLRPAVFQILLALAGGELHGLGIAAEVEEATGGGMELGPGTLYRSLKEMVSWGLIEDVVSDEAADPRRKYYGITDRGRVMLGEEARRMARVVELARQRSVLREGDV